MVVENYRDVEPILRHVVAVTTRVSGDDEGLLGASCCLANALMGQQKSEAAEPILRRCYAQSMRLHGPDDESTLQVALNLATCLTTLGNCDEALTMMQTCRAGYTRMRGSESMHALTCANQVANTLVELQRFDEADAMFTEHLLIAK